jgi:hypothetical protein
MIVARILMTPEASRTCVPKTLPTLLRRCGWAIGVAGGRLRNKVVESRRRFRVRLEKLGVGADIAGGENSQWLAGQHLAGEFDFEGGGAQEVASIPVACADELFKYRNGRRVPVKK